ncbi:hypothetical protein PAHA111176_11265 [Parendozoicomonas haliclonae]|uniref:RING-type domain-containing protein n=2 Tax=Parendozoicomonas haliclonae TaxID=1960125 RepID=A0A1X7ALC5_9GAMM|nr:hypothetical protein EHSB41UT_02694 [Parendozoicomonas haliclonae]
MKKSIYRRHNNKTISVTISKIFIPFFLIVLSLTASAGKDGVKFDKSLGVSRYEMSHIPANSLPGSATPVTPLKECSFCSDIPRMSPYICSSCSVYACQTCVSDYQKQVLSHPGGGIMNCPDCHKKIVSVASSSSESTGLEPDGELSSRANISEADDGQGSRYHLVDGWGESLGSLDVLCGNEGCSWTMKYGDGEGKAESDKHARNCSYGEDDCTAGCGEKVKRNNPDEHQKTCAHALVPCPDCNGNIARKLVDEHQGSDDCRLEKAALYIGRLQLDSPDARTVFELHQELVRSMSQKMNNLEEVNKQLQAKVDQQNYHLQLQANVNKHEGDQIIVLNLDGPPDTPLPETGQTYFSEPFRIGGNLRGDALLMIAVSYPDAQSSDTETSGNAYIYLLGSQNVLDRLVKQHETIDVDLLLLYDGEKSRSPMRLTYHLSSVSYQAIQRAPKIEGARFIPLGYGSDPALKEWLVRPQHIKTRRAAMLVRNRKETVSLMPPSELSSAYQQSPVAISDNELHIAINFHHFLSGGRIDYRFLLNGKPYTVNVQLEQIATGVNENHSGQGRAVQDSHVILEFIEDSWPMEPRIGQGGISAHISQIHYQGNSPGIFSNQAIKVGSESFRVPIGGNHLAFKQFVIRFAQEGSSDRFLLSELPLSQHSHSAAHGNSNFQLKSLLLASQERARAKEQQFQKILSNISAQQDIRYGTVSIDNQNSAITWVIPEMEACLALQLNEVKTLEARVGDFNYWLRFYLYGNGMYNFAIYANQASFFFGDQPGSFNKMRFHMAGNTTEVYDLDVGKSGLIFGSDIWYAITHRGYGWPGLVGLSDSSAEVKPDAQGQLKVTLEFVNDRPARNASRRTVSSNSRTRVVRNGEEANRPEPR